MKPRPRSFRLLIDLTRREFKMRYLGSLLGSYWNLIHPLVMILIYTLVFSQVMKARLGADSGPFSYSLYLCSGLIAWNFFSEVINRCTVTLLDNSAFMKKLSFSPFILFCATLASATINFFIAFSIFLVVLLLVSPVSIGLFATYFAVMILMAIFCLGLGVALGCMNVFMRDIQQMVSVVFQLWFWFTPIVYLAEALPEIARKMLYFNPAWAFIEPLHILFYFKRYPDPIFWLLMCIWVVLSSALGWFVYSRSISSVRDHI